MTADQLIPDDLDAARQSSYERNNVSAVRPMIELVDPDAECCWACSDPEDSEHWTDKMHAWWPGPLDPPWPWLGLPRADALW